MVDLYKEQHSEGIVLRSTLFKERDRIITLFTKEAGVITLVVKKAHHQVVLTSPLCQGEFLYVRGKSDLYRFVDGSVIEDNRALRSGFKYLTSAGEMVQAILHSQLSGKPAPKLYLLLTTCLKQLPLFEKPLRLSTSFQLKLLTHEGVISWEKESLFPILLTTEEWLLLKESAQARSFQKIREIPVNETLSLKIQDNFKKIL